VGRNFKLHLLTAVLAVSPSRKTDLLRKTTLLLDDRTPHSSVQALGFDAELITTLIPRYVPRPFARAIGARAYGFFLQTEDGSHPDNRVRGAGPTREHPLVDYDAARIPAAAAEHRELVANLRRDLLRAGYVTFAQPIGLHGTAHALGTLVAGDDPRTSVVDAVGRVHGLEGLTVADGSVLPRSSRVNPALTIYAWALRAAERLAQRLAAATRAEPVPEPMVTELEE
jgi:choline dehydrogenase-like flavoprotein